ncbi:MAG: hypothetical protein Fur009_7150 [Candidatus Microgenomates bacterium]
MKTKKFITFFLTFLLVVILYKNFSEAVFLKNQERVNVVLYGENSFYLSFSKIGVNYLIRIPVDAKILVPGGYGYYRNGGLGKLSALDKKPEIIKKAYSGATSSFVDLYFYTTDKIYFKNDQKNLSFPKIKTILFDNSNANFIDRLLLIFKIIKSDKSDFKIIDIGEDFFDQESFNKDYQGIFYKKIYRDKMPTVQIIYKKSYRTAYFLGNIIMGEGIRVVDLTEDENMNVETKCQIITKNLDIVTKSLSSYFNCQLKKGEPSISDIILKLGSLEVDWAVK